MRWASCWGAGGFTSVVVHAGGPPINAYLLPMRLPPVTFTAAKLLWDSLR